MSVTLAMILGVLSLIALDKLFAWRPGAGWKARRRIKEPDPWRKWEREAIERDRALFAENPLAFWNDPRRYGEPRLEEMPQRGPYLPDVARYAYETEFGAVHCSLGKDGHPRPPAPPPLRVVKE